LFLDRHEAAVLRYLRGIAPDPDAAEDALQETFVAAWRAAATFRSESSARGWLLTIARHALARQRRRVPAPEHMVSLEQLAQEAGWGATPSPGVEGVLEARDLVERGFAALSAEDREILILRELEGFSGEETARLLGLSLAAMKSRLHRARLRFTAALAGGM
jgi:RNA polymerase sigma-70 factor (ECF subfamily)